MSKNFATNKLKLRGNKNKTITTIALTLMLTFAVFAVSPLTKAHTPPWTMQTYAYIAIAPNTIGVGQNVFIIMWVSPNPPTAQGIAGDRWRNFRVEITKPNGNTQKLGPYISDPTGSTFALYTPDQIGTYKFVFKYPGQVLSLYGPSGLPGNPASVWINDTYTASEATAYLTVQQEPVTEPPTYPLPTGYWTRPIEGANTGWASIASNWLGGASIYGRLQADGVAPSSPHIMWTKPLEFGGIVGGTNAAPTGSHALPGVDFYPGQSYEGRYTSPMIVSGRLYFPVPLGHSGGGGGYSCVDLQTGEEIWHRDDIGNTVGNTSSGAPNTIPSPTFGQLYWYDSQNQHGVVGGILWQSSTASGITTWQAIDPYTGKWLYNLTSIPTGTEIYTNKGEIVRYVLNYNTAKRSGWLALWNNTYKDQGLELVDPYGGLGTNAYQWRPNGKVVNMSKAYSWNVTITADLSGQSAPTIVQVIPGDIILGRSTTFTARAGTPDPYTLWAISDKPTSRGQLLWIRNYTAPGGNISRNMLSGTVVDPVNRVFLMNDLETMQLLGYSLDTGELLWGPSGENIPAFQYYGTVGTSGQTGYMAYGNLYMQGYGGEIRAHSTKTGDVLWVYNNTFSAHETPWGNYPIFIGAIADGKIYAFNSEHSPNGPLYKGERVRCIDAYSGKELWTMLSWASVGGFDSGAWPVADGFVVYRNAYDNQIYCIGKGPSATTVTASPKVTTKGSSVIIEGTVTDQAAGAKQLVADGLFNVVPAMSDESMGPWMEYLYMQKPKPENATGVTVKLTAIDSNGNTQDIGSATSDTRGAYSLMWQPPIEGKYTIIATFEGSNSYWSSSAETAIGITAAAAPVATASPAPTATPTPTATAVPTASPSMVSPPPGYGLGTEYYIAIAAVIIIIAIAAVAVFLRRRK